MLPPGLRWAVIEAMEGNLGDASKLPEENICASPRKKLSSSSCFSGSAPMSSTPLQWPARVSQIGLSSDGPSRVDGGLKVKEEKARAQGEERTSVDRHQEADYLLSHLAINTAADDFGLEIDELDVGQLFVVLHRLVYRLIVGDARAEVL